ncbi:hypothetical protein LEN26_000904 [Aphanomyces euteiches]|nr:hypothetical protein AeMF1_010806 [Aphanomyces euteiches]KAH9162576.1 hypothetical protein LEN26_000904 [Aphanomyces euteiches]KAH9187263.1 hypothetical protein AeNC1_010762 [Aphanomyces euteiches]
MFRIATSTALRQLKGNKPAATTLALASSAPVAPRSFSKARMAPLMQPQVAVAPAHVKGDITTIAIAVAAVLGVAGVGKIWWDASSAANATITKESLASYFNELADIVEELVSQMPQLTEQVMQQARATGQDVSEAQVKAILSDRLGQAVQMADRDLAQKYKFSQESIEVAMLELQDTPEVQVAIFRLQTIIQNSPLGETVELPEDLTADRTLDILAQVLESLGRAMKEAIDDAKKAGMKDVTAEAHMWQENYMKKTTAYTEEVHTQYGVSEPVLNAAVSKYSQDPNFQAQLQALLEKHQKNFQEMGLQV